MFYNNFKALCDSRGEHPYSLVKELGAKSPHVIEQWKKGSTPRQPMLGKIAEHFGVTIDYLLTGEEKQPAFFKNLQIFGEQKQPAGSGELSEDEIKLLAAYRKILDQKKPGYLDMLERAAEHKE